MSLPTTGAGPSAGAEEAWTPASPTTDGAASPHTWHYAGSGDLFQDSGKGTPATSDGDPVGASVNQGSDSHDIVQATSANKPTLKLAILNGEPVFRCDGGDDLDATYNGALSSPYTAFAVAILDSGLENDGNNYYMFGTKGAPAQSNMVKHATPTPDGFVIRQTDSISDGPAADDSWHVWGALFNGAASELWIDGGSSSAGNLVALNPAGHTLGSRNGGSLGWVGDIAECLIYDSNLSDADKNEIGAYLAAKYGLTWAVVS